MGLAHEFWQMSQIFFLSLAIPSDPEFIMLVPICLYNNPDSMDLLLMCSFRPLSLVVSTETWLGLAFPALLIGLSLGFPGEASGKKPSCQYRRLERYRFDPWVERTPLEEGMTIHSSILAWRIPLTEEPSGLQSMGLQRVRHD